MGAIAELIERPREVLLGGRRFLMGPLRLGHLAELQAAATEITRQESERVLEQAAAATNAMVRRELVSRAYDDVRRAYASPEDVERFLGTVPGVALLCWLCVRDASPTTTREEVEAALEGVSASDAAATAAILNEALGLGPGN